MLITIGIIFFLTFIQRSLFQFFNKDKGFDVEFHIFLIQFLRTSKVSQLGLVRNRLGSDANLNYPFFLHFIISKLPKAIEKTLLVYFNPLLESLVNICLFYFIYFETKNPDMALSGSLLYIFSPLLFSVQALGPRVSNFTPRLLGEILTNTTFIMFFLFSLNQDYLFFICGVFFASLVFITSKFSVQALVFIAIITSIITFNLYLILMIVVSFLLSLVYSGGLSWELLSQQFRHLSWYFRANKQKKMYVSNRNNFRELLKTIFTLDFKKFHELIVNKNSYILVIFKLPVLILLLAEIASFSTFDLKSYFIFSSLIVFFLCSLQLFLFLGEAERYLNHTIIFIIALFVSTNVSADILYILYGYGILFQGLDFIWFFRHKKKNDVSNVNAEIVRYLNEIEGNHLVATIPFHLGGWQILNETKHNWFYPPVWLHNEKKKEFDEKYLIRYPDLNIERLAEIKEKYHIDIFIIDEAKLKNINFEYPKHANVKKTIDNIVILESDEI